MADPLSMASAIAGLVSLADLVLTKTYHYLSAVKSAEENIRDLQRLLESMYGTMQVLKTRLRVLDNLSTMSTSLYTRPGIIDDCTRLLDDINQKLAHYDSGKNTSRMKQHLQKLRWPFEASQTNELVEKLSRFNQVIVTALQGDTLAAVYETFRAASEIRDDIKKLERTLSVKINNLVDIEFDKAQQEAFNFYNRCDPKPRHETAKRLCQQGTGTWFTESEIFTAWLEGPRKKLWLSGIPGAGKTILASSIIQRARLQIAQMIESAALVYFYCDYNNPKSQEVDNILGTIAAQLSQQATKARDLLTQQYDTFYKPGRASMLKDPPDLSDTIKFLCSCYENVFLIVDGLDECGENVNNVTKHLKNLGNTSDTTVRCIFLSRIEFDIEQILLPDFEEIKIAAQSNDLKLFVHSQLEDIDDDDPEFKSEILNTFVTKADGMFRWVACQIDYLRDLPSVEERKKALHELPPDLNSSYDRILERVNQKPSSTQEMVHLTLTWLILGERWHLNFAALREALAVRCGQTRLQRDKIPREQAVLRHCSSFIRRSADGHSIEPAHFTVAEYLTQIPTSHSTLSRYRVDKSDGTLLLAKSCLTYLRFDDFSDIQSIEQVERRTLDYRLREHAVTAWNKYARSGLTDKVCSAMAVEFCGDVGSPNHLTWLYDFAWYSSKAYTEWDNKRRLEVNSDQLSCTGAEVNKDISTEKHIWSKLRDWTPVHCASLLRLPEIVKHFFEEGVDANLQSAVGTPVQLALLSKSAFDDNVLWELTIDDGCFETLQVLFEAGASPTCDWYDPILERHSSTVQIVLYVATRKKQRAEYVALMLEAGLRLNRHIVKSLNDHSLKRLFKLFPNTIKLEHIEDDYKAEWLDATRSYPEDSVDAILTKSADTSQLHLLHALFRSAAQADQAAVLNQLLSHQEIDVNAVDDEGRTALSLAAERGSLNAIRFLLDHDADTDRCDNFERTAVHYAISGGRSEAAEMLYRSGARMDLKDHLGYTAWSDAGHFGDIAMLKLLQAEHEGTESAYRLVLAEENSPLFAACRAGEDEAILFLAQFADAITVHDPEGRNLAHYVKDMKADTIRKLIGLKLNCLQRDHHGRTPLHSLCAEEDIDMSCCENIEILLQQGCRSTDTCHDGNTPLHVLFENQDTSINQQVLRLLCTDVVLEMVNSAGHTPLDSLLLHKSSSPTDFNPSFDYLAENSAKPASETSCKAWQYILLTADETNMKQSSDVFVKLLEVWQIDFFPNLQNLVQRIGIWAALNSMSGLLGIALRIGIDICKRDREVADDSILVLVCTKMHDTHIIERVFQNIDKEQVLRKDSELEYLLHLACGQGGSNHTVITELLKKGWDTNKRDKFRGLTPLMLAADTKKDQHMRVLLEANADLGIQNFCGMTVFPYAVISDDPRMVQLLIDRCNDDSLWRKTFTIILPRTLTAQEYTLRGSTLVHLASNEEILQMVLNQWPDADLNQRNDNGMTPLHVICAQPLAWKAVKYLISGNANLHARDSWCKTALHWAAERQSLEALRTLLESGAETDAIDSNGNTPMHDAASCGSYPIVQCLLEAGAASIRNAKGLTPELVAHTHGFKDIADKISQHYSQNPVEQRRTKMETPTREQTGSQSQAKSELKRLEIYESFLKAISDGDRKLVTEINTMVNTDSDPPCSGCTPVSTALRRGSTELAKLLLDLGYSSRSYGCSCVGEEHYDAMQLAASNPELQGIVEQLLSKVHPNDQQRPLANRRHPAMVAIQENNPAYLKAYLERFRAPAFEDSHPVGSIKVESDDKDAKHLKLPHELDKYIEDYGYGAGLLHVAAAFNDIEVVEYLSDWPELISATDDNLATPLHYAAASDAVETIDVLLELGADIEARTSWGTSPLYVAASWDRSAAVHRLLQKGAQAYFSNVQLFCEYAMFENPTCQTVILATRPCTHDFDTPSITPTSFTRRFTSLCFLSNVMIDLFKTRHWALGHYILFNGMRLLKHVLKWLELYGALKQQLEFSGPSVLCLAAQYGDTEIVENLLKYGADMNALGCDEGTALAIACGTNRLEMVKYLVRKGAEMCYKDSSGKEVSCFEAAGKYERIVRWLLVERHNDQRRIGNSTHNSNLSQNSDVPAQPFKLWSGLHRVKSPLPPEFKQARGDTLLEWHIRKRRDIQAYEGKVLHYGAGITYPFFNYE